MTFTEYVAQFGEPHQVILMEHLPRTHNLTPCLFRSPDIGRLPIYQIQLDLDHPEREIVFIQLPNGVWL